MPERAFYDTVIFALSINPADGDHVHCRALLDVDSGTLTWCIVLSAITRGEATLHEYLDPQDKGRRGKKTRGTVVRDVLRDELSVHPMFPGDALVRLRAGPPPP